MKNLIVSFKSRNELYSFLNLLKRNGIFSTIINTPKSIGSSCMLSLKTDFKHVNRIQSIIQTVHLKSFVGLFAILSTPYGEQTSRLM